MSRDSSGVRIYRNVLAKAKEANVFGFELNGRGNRVRDNIGADAPDFLVNIGGRRPLADGGGNRRARQIAFDSIGCRGLRSGLTAIRGVRMIEPTQVHEIEIAKWDALASVPATDAELMVAHSRLRGTTRAPTRR